MGGPRGFVVLAKFMKFQDATTKAVGDPWQRKAGAGCLEHFGQLESF